jgi:hypothetical protein
MQAPSKPGRLYLELRFRGTQFAFLAGEFRANAGGAAFGGGNPFADSPRWVVADVLGVSAVEVGDPVELLVLVERDDFAMDGHEEDFTTGGAEFTERSGIGNADLFACVIEVGPAGLRDHLAPGSDPPFTKSAKRRAPKMSLAIEEAPGGIG